MFAAGFLEAKMTLSHTMKHTQNFMNATFPADASKTPALLATATSFVTSNGKKTHYILLRHCAGLTSTKQKA